MVSLNVSHVHLADFDKPTILDLYTSTRDTRVPMSGAGYIGARTSGFSSHASRRGTSPKPELRAKSKAPIEEKYWGPQGPSEVECSELILQRSPTGARSAR